jgi:hypothetical protein
VNRYFGIDLEPVGTFFTKGDSACMPTVGTGNFVPFRGIARWGDGAVSPAACALGGAAHILRNNPDLSLISTLTR